MSTNPQASQLAVAMFEAFARNSGNSPSDHFDRNAAEQWMQQALDECLPKPAAAQEAGSPEPYGWHLVSNNQGYRGQESFTRNPVMAELIKAGMSGSVDVTPLFDHPPPAAPVTAALGIDLAALRARVVSAIERITSGTGQMRVPADLTDPDLVLADVLTLLDALDPHCTDSPKGGSEARDAVLAALVEAATAVERADADGELTDDLVDRLRAARDAAQAGDAEVQP